MTTPDATNLVREALLRHSIIAETPLIECMCRRDRLTITEWSQHATEAVLAALAPIRAAERQEAARAAWDEGYETGRDDECFDQRGLSTDSDAHEYPHANPYRADGVTGRSGT